MILSWLKSKNIYQKRLFTDNRNNFNLSSIDGDSVFKTTPFPVKLKVFILFGPYFFLPAFLTCITIKDIPKK